MSLNISKFLDQFFMEAGEKITGIQENMARLEDNPRLKDAILTIQRDMHTIKGTSRMVGLMEISDLAHHLEDAFIQLNSERIKICDEVMAVIYRGIDGVEELLRQAKEKKPLKNTAPLLEEIGQLLRGNIVPASKIPKPEQKEDEPTKRKFKLDFNILKKKIKTATIKETNEEIDNENKLETDSESNSESDKALGQGGEEKAEPSNVVDSDSATETKKTTGKKKKSETKSSDKERIRNDIAKNIGKAIGKAISKDGGKEKGKLTGKGDKTVSPKSTDKDTETDSKPSKPKNESKGTEQRTFVPTPPSPRKTPLASKPVQTQKATKPIILDESSTAGKTYLKIDSGQFESIINQVTDLLSKRYFFNNVLQTTRGLTRMTRGLRSEWQQLKLSGMGTLDAGGHLQQNLPHKESADNIDNTIDLFFRKLQEFERDYQVNLTNFEHALRDVYDNLLDMKLTPLSNIFTIYPRFIRDYAYRTGKKIRCFVRGGDTQLDKTVIEKINEPLVHLIRNACDHGIEAPEVREKNGKSATGTIIIEATKKSNNVEIKISDDGKGLDRDIILKKAIENKLVDTESAQGLDDQQVFEFIFHTGFSTAEQVSDTSGRGIGMDIVKKITHQFGGSIQIQSTAGQGTTFRLEFPVSIFTNKITYIKEEGTIYAVPSNLIRRIVKLYPGEIREKSDYSVVVYNDDIYTVSKLNQVLAGETAGVGEEPVFMLLPKVTDRKIGIIVDEILYEAEIIVKDLGKFLGKKKYVYGMVVGEKGELHTVLDLYDIADSDEFSKKIKIITPLKTKQGDKQELRILVVDDSLLVREMERNLLENAGYTVATAINGLDGYNKALSQRFDLVLADIEMPEMNGFEMIENIKKIEEYTDVPTIVLSSVENEEDKIRGINLGVNAWLQKQNFNDTEMLKVVKRFIG